jgi:hypothetical protein
MRELTRDQLIIDMMNTEQTKGMSILDHGISVNRYFEDLYSHLKNDTDLKFEWRLPEWIMDNKEFILSELSDLKTIREYQINHDCGKPYCRTVDEDGRVHFPNHAEISKETWLSVHGHSDIKSVQVANLIGMDMDIHLLKGTGVEEFKKRPEAITLLITGLCELHSNASMFGGISSTSFKIKWKNINKRGKAILK